MIPNRPNDLDVIKLKSEDLVVKVWTASSSRTQKWVVPRAHEAFFAIACVEDTKPSVIGANLSEGEEPGERGFVSKPWAQQTCAIL